MFDAAKADRAVHFIERLLTHTKDRWAGTPFILEPWQRDEIIRPLFGTVAAGGMRQYRRAYIEIPKKNGKLLDLDTAMLTGEGWKDMGTLQVGDEVHAPDGSLTQVVAVSDVETEAAFELTFASGQRLVAGAQHQWRVFDHTLECWRICTTEDIASNLEYGRSYKQGRRFHVEVTPPLVRGANTLPIDPYVLGAWLGDGSAASAQITGLDDGIFEQIAAGGYVVSHHQDPKSHWIRGLLAQLRPAGLLRNKHIPQQYLLASVPQRLALLQGLMDTDGSVILGPSRWPRCEFMTIDPELGGDVLFLARSLGWKATMAEGRAMLNGKNCGPRYRVAFTAYRERSPFRLARKTLRLRATPLRPTRANVNKIIAVRPVGTRQLRCIQVAHPSRCYLAGEGLIPTHNSELAAAVALKLLFDDGTRGGEIYGAAGDREQASIVFNVAAQMVRNSAVLTKRAKIIDSSKRIIDRQTDSFYRAIPADAYTKHGFNPSGIIFDELHVQPNRELWDVLTSGTGARTQPLTFAITTAGWDRSSICWEQHEHARKVREGLIQDPSFFSFVLSAPPDVDWRDERVWHKYNPALGKFLNLEIMRDEARTAEQEPGEQNRFRRLHLCQWVSQQTRWLPVESWDASAGVLSPDLTGRPCWGGLSLTSTSEIAAFVLVFPPQAEDGGFQALPFFWIPRENLRDRVLRDGVPYDVWAERGLIQLTEGNVIHYGALRHDIEQLAQKYLIQKVAYNRLGAVQLTQELEEAGIPIEPLGYGYKDFSPPTKELLNLVLARRLRHGGNEVLRSMADALEVQTSGEGELRPIRADRVQGMTALIMALSLATQHKPSRYESEPVLVLG